MGGICSLFFFVLFLFCFPGIVELHETGKDKEKEVWNGELRRKNKCLLVSRFETGSDSSVPFVCVCQLDVLSGRTKRKEKKRKKKRKKDVYEFQSSIVMSRS